MKKRKTILILTILLFGVFLSINFAQAAKATPDQTLEIVYPQIPGYTAEKVIFSGLPEYIEYIFRLSIWIIGFVILGALIYAGFQYFTSFGNPEKLSSAKNGITSAIFGAIILLSAVLIFNTINPQLVILEAPPLDVLDPTVMPGIYLCDKWVDNINNTIDAYMYGDKNMRLAAAKEFIEIMHNDKGSCFRVPKSGNLKIGGIKKFEFESKKHTIFAIPQEKPVYNLATKEVEFKWVFDYGIIFHEKDNFQGLGRFPAPYQKIDIEMVLGVNKAASVTLFQKLDYEPGPESQGVILYQCLNYDDPTLCPEGVSVTAGTPFSPGEGNNVRGISTEELGNLAGGTETTGDKIAGARSIRIDPVGSFFAILYGTNPIKYKTKKNPAGHFCEVISNNDPNLLDNEIGRCGAGCQIVARKDETPQYQNRNCHPCLKSMDVIKGQVLK